MPAIEEYPQITTLNGTEIVYVVVNPDLATPTDGYINLSAFTGEDNFVPYNSDSLTITSSTLFNLTSTGTMDISSTGATTLTNDTLDVNAANKVTINSAYSNVFITAPVSGNVNLNAGNISIESDDGILIIRDTAAIDGDVAELILTNGTGTFASGDTIAIVANNSVTIVSPTVVNLASGSAQFGLDSVANSLTASAAAANLNLSNINFTTDIMDMGGAYQSSIGAGSNLIMTEFASGFIRDLDLTIANYFDITMDQDCSFTFSGFPSTQYSEWMLILRGAFTPLWPPSVTWPGGAPVHGELSVYKFFTRDNGATIYAYPVVSDNTASGGAVAIEYVQTLPVTSWLIDYNLNFRPNVQTFTSTGEIVHGNIIHHSPTQLEIQFNTARLGTAVLS